MHPHREIEGPPVWGDVKADVWATSDTHVGVELKGVRINRVDYFVRLDLTYRDGQWQRGYLEKGTDKVNWSSVWNALYMRRMDGNGDPSTAARERAGEILEPWLVEYIESVEGLELVRQGAETHYAYELEKITREVDELETKRAELEEAHRIAAERLAEHRYPGAVDPARVTVSGPEMVTGIRD